MSSLNEKLQQRLLQIKASQQTDNFRINPPEEILASSLLTTKKFDMHNEEYLEQNHIETAIQVNEKLEKKPKDLPVATGKTKFIGFTLMINCSPVKVPIDHRVITLEELVLPYAKELAEEHNVPHYRMISNEFGVAAAFLIKKIDAFLASARLDNTVIIVATLDGLMARDCVEAMKPYAGIIVRGQI